MKNKIVALGLAFATLTWAAPMIGQAATTDELQAQITALLVQIAALQAQLQTPSTTACFTLQLKFGSTGSEVTALQTALKGDATVYPEGLVTGYFGSLTEKAVKAFQTKYGIEAVGQVGPITRAKLNSFYCVTATPTPTPTATPVVGPLTVTLASDNPAGVDIQRGSANNSVLKLKFTAGSTALNVAGLTVKSYGTTRQTSALNGNAVTDDINAVKVFDENGIQIGDSRAMVGGQSFFVFVPALAISANGSRTINVTVSLGTAAQVMANVLLGVDAATAISGGTFSATYPVKGNSFMIVPSGQLGNLNVGKYSTVPKTNVKIGEKDIVIQKFIVSAGSVEGVTINQVSIKNGGQHANASDSDLSNIRLRTAAGTIVGGPVTLSNKKATINLSTPITLTKGQSQVFDVIADIANGDNDVISMMLLTGAVIGVGTTSGTSMNSAAGYADGDDITIGEGKLVVSMSSNHPQGANALMIKTANTKTLAAFSVRANGEDIIISSATLNFWTTHQGVFITAGHPLTSVGLYVGDTLVSDLQTVDDDNDAVDFTFALNWTVPANTTQDFVVKGVTFATLPNAAGDALRTTWATAAGVGMSSGIDITSTLGVVTSNVTIYPAGTATLAPDSVKTPYNQGILTGAANVALAALKVYAQREDQKLTHLVVTPFVDLNGDSAWTNEAADASRISSLTIYADDGVTQLSNPVAAVGNVFTFETDDMISDIVFTKGVYKTVVLKGNTTGGDQANLALAITTAGDFVTQGVDSAADFDTATANFQIVTPYAGGRYAVDNTIVEMKKASNSPSGSVARGAQTETAIWDVENKSADLGDAIITDIVFTSKVGLSSGLGNGDFALFKLYDEAGNLLATATSMVAASGTVTFDMSGGGVGDMTLTYGLPKQLKLVVDTTSTTKFISSSQMQWSIATVAGMTITGPGYLGYAGTTWSIPATANVVTMP